jgi:acetolactate synthase-1/2/3 large subunit
MLSADAAWSTGSEKIVTVAPASRPAFDAEAVEAVARLIADEGRSTLILVGNDGLHTDAVAALAAISGKYGCRVMAQCANVSVSRGAGRYPLSRLPYIVDNAVALLKRFKHVILIDSAEPVAFFTYPDKPSKLCGVGTSVHQMTTSGEDSVAAAIALAESLGASAGDIVWPEVPAKAAVTGQLTPETIAAVIARSIPENGIVVDEALTGGRALYPATASSAPHDWLQNTGGSIGFALPAALGAAVAGCGRRVFAISGDGSAAYTFQALWTYARENLNVTTIILANNSYEILKGEYAKVGAGEAKFRARELLDLGRPQIDWTRIAGGLGVATSSVSSAEEFDRQLQIAARETGPSLIEVRFAP